MVKSKIEETSSIAGAVEFKCPKCGKGTIKRSFHERQLATKYICPNEDCKFEGPN